MHGKSDILSQTEMKFSMLQHFDCPNQLKMHISFFQAQNIKLFIRNDGLTSDKYKTETTFKCLICSAILMNDNAVKVVTEMLLSQPS